MNLHAQNISLSPGLIEDNTLHDSSLQVALDLWNELHPVSLEASQFSGKKDDLSLFSFAASCLFFAIIVKPYTPDDDDDDNDSGNAQAYDDACSRIARLTAHESPEWADNTDNGLDYACHEPPSRSLSSWLSSIPPRTPPRPRAVGLIYCTSSQSGKDATGEVNIGVALDRRFRGRGFARQAIELVLTWVFESLHFHRVQACVVDNEAKDRAITLFTQLGFVYEGIRRRSALGARDGTWRDVIYLAMLNTEWFMRSYFTPAPWSVWNAMLACQEQERQALLRWEPPNVGARRFQRSASLETLRDASTPQSVSPQSAHDVGEEASGQSHATVDSLLKPQQRASASKPKHMPQRASTSKLKQMQHRVRIHTWREAVPSASDDDSVVSLGDADDADDNSCSGNGEDGVRADNNDKVEVETASDALAEWDLLSSNSGSDFEYCMDSCAK